METAVPTGTFIQNGHVSVHSEKEIWKSLINFELFTYNERSKQLCLKKYVCVFYSLEAQDLGGPSNLIFNRGNPDEAEEDIDSDTDDIDHTGEKDPSNGL